MRFSLLSPLVLNPVIRFSNSNALFGLRFQLYPRYSGYLRSPVTMASAKPKPAAAVNKFPVEEECVGIARKCWIKFKRESTFALYTPFVVSLASGTLNLDTFRHYIAQDVHFLKSFAQAYEAAEECTDDDDAKVGISELRKNVIEELKMHDAVLKEWDIDLVKESTLNPATAKYTDFLSATASGKVEGVKAAILATPFERTKLAAYTLGAMTPCMRLYAYIGKELQAFLEGEKIHPYKKWIDSYASEGFQASALQTEDLLDKLSVPLTGEELDIIEKLYHQAMKLEIDFFLTQPLVQKAVIPLSKDHNPAEHRLTIFSDFDLTCTVVDSSAILAEIAIITAPRSDQNRPENQIARMLSADLRNTWGDLSKQYTEEYEQCIEKMLLTEKAEKFDYERLHKTLEELSDFEKRANTRVIESGVLKGLNLEDIKRAGQRLILQDGCTNFFQSIIRNENLNADIHVLSYCWCGDLIRSSFSSGGIDALNVHANEFMFQESLSTGEIVKKVESPIDKVQAFSKIRMNCGNDQKNLTVYIGDSVGDLLCLLEADVGIVLGTSSSLRTVGNHFGVSFVPLFPGVVQKQKMCTGVDSSSCWKGLSGVLYTASSWAEIHAFVLGS
ncbi:bifunctional TH2 protein, mitochondrial [Nicotiana tabacum]|uniref:Bifunctional TH2 protein, mitochondrial n=1 Tax=Nicotiana tabacum TaxID=4097 RepID=A0A1S4AML7_TOBAC|nr:PREDICTED: probable aminopyrimidine aminohydrolase, mitochondrial [Nicotiana tabacum]